MGMATTVTVTPLRKHEHIMNDNQIANNNFK